MSAAVVDPKITVAPNSVTTTKAHHLSLRIWLGVAVMATALDAALSYLSIEVLKIAAEGNPLLLALDQQIGFLLTMHVRFLVGATLLYIVYRIALNTGERSLAARGLHLVSFVLVALVGYHALILAAGLLLPV